MMCWATQGHWLVLSRAGYLPGLTQVFRLGSLNVPHFQGENRGVSRVPRGLGTPNARHFGGSLIVLLFGAPGSGKGTQSRFISERRKIPAISTGDMLRAECRNETVLGLAAKSILANGGLVDDEL